MAWTTIGGRARLAVAGAVLLSAACGGGSSPTAPPPPTLPPAPPAPVVVSSGSGTIGSETLGYIQFTTTAGGRLDITVDWTFASNDLDIALVKGFCTEDQFLDGSCNPLAITESETAKPEKLSVPSTTAGQYTLYVANFGDRDESISYQAVLTASATGASAGATASDGGRTVGGLHFKRATRAPRPLQ